MCGNGGVYLTRATTSVVFFFFSESCFATASLGQTRFDLRFAVNDARASASHTYAHMGRERARLSYLKVSLHGVRQRAPFNALASLPEAKIDGGSLLKRSQKNPRRSRK